MCTVFVLICERPERYISTVLWSSLDDSSNLYFTVFVLWHAIMILLYYFKSTLKQKLSMEF